VPRLQIGMVEGAAEYQLSRVRGAVRLSDGRVVVANGDSRELRWYDAGGRFVTAAGRPGGGPGEFRGLDAVYPYPGDSVAAWDPESRRLSVFAPDGRFAREVTLTSDALAVTLRGVLADGSLLLEPTGTLQDFVGMRDGERRDTVAYLRYTRDGAFADTLARRADREHVTLRAGNLITQESVLFGRDSYAAAGGTRAFVGQSDAYAIDVLGADGARMQIRRAGEPRPVSREQLRLARADAEERRERNDAQIARAAGGNALLPGGDAEVPARETVPAFDQLLVDTQGNLWARDFRITLGDTQRWSVFDPAGRWLGTVRTPAGVEIYQIGPDWILGRARDELEVEYVRLYPLHRG
jgi:hypothetical protein